jgi:DNA adenine methylase
MSSNLSKNQGKLSTTSPLRYPGGKTRAIPLLTKFLPKNLSGNVLSPFLGGGSFELYLTSIGCVVHGFDAYAPLVNFWVWVEKNPKLLANKIRARMPVDQVHFKTFQNNIKTKSPSSVKLAAEYLIVNRCSFSGATMSGGFSSAAASGRMTESIVKRIENFNNPLLKVSFGDFQKTIKPGYDFIFADPPYWLEDSASKLYGNSGDMHLGFNHEQFFKLISKIKDPWMITYNDSSKVRDLYKDFNVYPVNWSYGMNSSKKSSEIIICNYKGNY